MWLFVLILCQVSGENPAQRVAKLSRIWTQEQQILVCLLPINFQVWKMVRVPENQRMGFSDST